ncbi:universal stress protein [Actinoplanes xinjiangensis]|uniref:Universal stress protein family protein n=1 Tax=Actinoplanes xinjiangensis TaxID=512350 RepID=A0A316F3N1_9ACTN|nr:universal stress protein [Actinoplanes xinjiangensis]PWK39876.1 universal stress protein family protein [Actinoplanes xinjiangensis]GIF42843.1 hypothetical protein Axi01nite_71540 [Actinoplanes xinjiangensis]
MNNTIIIGYDGSPDARTALTWALDEAARTLAPAEIVYADQWPIWEPAASLVYWASLPSRRRPAT